MRDNGNAVRFRDVADAHYRGYAADPRHIGLHYVHDALPCGKRERVDCVPVFAGREYLVRHALAHLDVAIEVIRRQVVFQPLEPIRAQRFGQPHDILGVQRNPRVQHQFDIIANLLARAGDEFHILVQPFDAFVGTVRQEQLHRLEAEFQEPVDAVGDAVGSVGVAGVAENLVLLRTAEQFIDRHAKQLAFEIPERVVNGADGVARQADIAVSGGSALHHVPCLFGRHAVLPDENRRELVVDDGVDRRGVDGDAQPPSAVFGGNHASGSAPRRAKVGFAELRVHHRGADPIGHIQFRHSRRGARAWRKVDGYGSD